MHLDDSGIKQLLDRFYGEYNFRERILHDPIEFPHRYRRPEDIEIAGFIAACLSYGRVDLFKPIIERILSIMGNSPYDFLINFGVKKQGSLFSGIRYRFNKNRDIICLLYILGEVLRRYGRIEKAFKGSYKRDDVDIGHALTGFVDHLQSVDTSDVYGRDIRPDGLIQFFPFPSKGSACKRMNLFLRWMIRDKDIDFGIWKGIPKNKLIIPLDTHIARISRCLGFTKRVSNDWKTAVEITEALKKLDPEDPLKYDFAMCHHGISGLCGKNKGDRIRGCTECVFRPKS